MIVGTWIIGDGTLDGAGRRRWFLGDPVRGAAVWAKFGAAGKSCFGYAIRTPQCPSVQGFSARGKFTEHEVSAADAADTEIGTEFLRSRMQEERSSFRRQNFLS